MNSKPMSYYHYYFQKAKNQWRAIIVIILVVIAISIITSLARPPLYRSRSRILVTQETNINLDMYKASQSAERLAILLAKVIKSSSFMKDVLNSGFPIDKSYFPAAEKELRKAWAKMVSSRVSTDTSIIEIEVYHTKQKEAEKITNAIIYVFSEQGKKYYNLGDQVGIVVLDTPLVSERPAKPNLALNIILGLAIGVILAAIYIFWNTPPDSLSRPKAPILEKSVQQEPEGPKPKPQIPDYLGHTTSLDDLKIIDQ